MPVPEGTATSTSSALSSGVLGTSFSLFSRQSSFRNTGTNRRSSLLGEASLSTGRNRKPNWSGADEAIQSDRTAWPLTAPCNAPTEAGGHQDCEPHAASLLEVWAALANDPSIMQTEKRTWLRTPPVFTLLHTLGQLFPLLLELVSCCAMLLPCFVSIAFL